MGSIQSIEPPLDSQASPGHLELKSILDTLDLDALLAQLEKPASQAGPRGYPVAALIRAYLASFILNLPHTAALVRRLQDDAELRMLCGFSKVPHRTTFSRFITKLTKDLSLLEACSADLVDRLAAALPGFGEKVAIDSTVVRTHSNPNRKRISDPEASWTAKNSAKAKDGKKEWYFGYKYHAVADATYGIPISGFGTTAKRNDSPELPDVMKQAAETHNWFAPEYVMADRGYDSEKNHRAVEKHGAIPIIAIRKTPGDKPREGIYTKDGAPTCLGMVEMEYVKSDPDKGHLYRCRQEGCHLKSRQGVRYCDDEVWENRQDRRRLFGQVRRGSKKWKGLYRLRYSIERVFKSLKESRRLEDHCFRGLDKIALHSMLSVLTFQATALSHIRAGEQEWLCWMVRKVA